MSLNKCEFMNIVHVSSHNVHKFNACYLLDIRKSAVSECTSGLAALSIGMLNVAGIFRRANQPRKNILKCVYGKKL